MKLTDWLGNEYAVGDTVVWPRSYGSSSFELSVGTVEEIRQTNGSYKVVVQPLGKTSRSSYGYWSGRKWNPETLSYDKTTPKKVTIHITENITVVGV